jgi:hypothetical protein
VLETGESADHRLLSELPDGLDEVALGEGVETLVVLNVGLIGKLREEHPGFDVD